MSSNPTRAKRCSKCQVTKPLDDFGIETRRPDGRRCFCRDCGNQQRRAHCSTLAYRQRRQTQSIRNIQRRIKLRKKYGISDEEYQGMLAKQGGCCAICHGTEPGGRWGVFFHVDHCHLTGRIRGLLCSACNLGIALLGDGQEGLRRALDYISEQGEGTQHV